MSKVKCVKYIGKSSVYNMTVSRVHNFMVHGGMIVKNCDMLRYYCISRTNPTEVVQVSARDYDDEEYEEDYESAMCGGEINAAYINC